MLCDEIRLWVEESIEDDMFEPNIIWYEFNVAAYEKLREVVERERREQIKYFLRKKKKEDTQRNN